MSCVYHRHMTRTTFAERALLTVVGIALFGAIATPAAAVPLEDAEYPYTPPPQSTPTTLGIPDDAPAPPPEDDSITVQDTPQDTPPAPPEDDSVVAQDTAEDIPQDTPPAPATETSPPGPPTQASPEQGGPIADTGSNTTVFGLLAGLAAVGVGGGLVAASRHRKSS